MVTKSKIEIENVSVTADSGKSMKSFRSSNDLEELVRYVHENGLRREVHMAIDYVTKTLKPKKKTRTRKSKTVQ